MESDRPSIESVGTVESLAHGASSEAAAIGDAGATGGAGATGDAGASGGAGSPAAPFDGFERLHPTSLLFGIGRHVRALLIPALFILFLARKGSWELWAAMFFIPSALYELFHYFTLRYRIQGDELIVRRGLIVKGERHVPLARIQNIDLVQNPLHRALGVAEVKVETAGGSKPEATFRVLSLAAVERLRRRVQIGRETAPPPATSDAVTLASGEAIATPPTAPAVAPDRRTLLRIDTWELAKLGLLSNRGMAIVLLGLGVAWELDVLDRIDYRWMYSQASALSPWLSKWLVAAVIVAALLALRVLSAVWMIVRFHGYELTCTGDDLRIRCGLLTRVTATIPRRRVQLVSIHETLFQRLLRRASLRVETAGGGRQADEADRNLLSRRWFVPFVDRGDVPRLLGEIRHGLDVELRDASWTPLTPRGRRRMMRVAIFVTLMIALVVAAVATAVIAFGGWTPPVGLRPWLVALGVLWIPFTLGLAWAETRFLAYSTTPEGLLFRSGGWTRHTSATFFDKMQTVSTHESPFDRRWGMAVIHVDTAGAGPAEHQVHIPCQPRPEAMALQATLLARMAQARWRW